MQRNLNKLILIKSEYSKTNNHWNKRIHKNTVTEIGQNKNDGIFEWRTKKFNLIDKLIQITEVFVGKGIHKTVDPKKKRSVT